MHAENVTAGETEQRGRHPRWWSALLAALLVAAAAGLPSAPAATAQAPAPQATTILLGVDGATVGGALFTQADGFVIVDVEAAGLPPGFHGFHIHAVGICDPSGAFASAGGHMALRGESHADHAGDQPSLLVQADGTARLSFTTDRYSLTDLFDADGSALIIHALPDNFGNIPTRYAPQPDAMTLATGDSGGRIACGVIESDAFPRSGPVQTMTAPVAIPSTIVTARDFAFDGPDTVPAGIVSITLQNAGAEPHDAQLYRLNTGVMQDAFLAADAATRATLGTPSGGPTNVPPGRSQSTILTLTEGNYLMISFGGQGMSRAFRVVNPPSGAAAPPSDGDLMMREFTFTAPAIRAGTTTLRATNAGQQPHNAFLYRLATGVTLNQVLTAPGDPEELQLVTPAGGLATIAPSSSAWLPLSLAAGNYAMLCFVTDPTSGQAHYNLGMAIEFTAQ